MADFKILEAKCGILDDTIKDPAVPARQINYSFLKPGDTPLFMGEILNLQYRIDEYRAKFKHTDLTPFTWHFKGGRLEGWQGAKISSELLIPDGQEIHSPTGLNIDASIYKYFSIKLTSSTDSESATYTLKWFDADGIMLGNQSFSFPTGSAYLVSVELNDNDNWTGTIDSIAIECPLATIAYVKVDKVDPLHIEKLADVDSFNQMVEKLERISGTPDGQPKDLSSIKVKQHTPISKEKLRALFSQFQEVKDVAYNGCSTCDVNQCTNCYETNYGRVNCQVCNECDQYQGCQASCNDSCYEQAIACTCYGSTACYGQETCTCHTWTHQAPRCSCNSPDTPATCTCQGTTACYEQGTSGSCSICVSCYGYKACTCDGKCNGQNCTTCYGTGKYYNLTCPCDGTYGTQCSGCDVKTPDDYCQRRNVNWCETNWCKPYSWCSVYGNGQCTKYTYNCKCYQVCNSYGPCTTNQPPDASYRNKTCSTCYECYGYRKDACFTKDGYSAGQQCACNQNKTCTCHNPSTGCYSYSSCTCDTRCNTQNPGTCVGSQCYGYTACTCDGKVAGHVPPKECTCNERCFEHQACQTCDVCNAYQSCTQCDVACDTDVCRACHKLSYH